MIDFRIFRTIIPISAYIFLSNADACTTAGWIVPSTSLVPKPDVITFDATMSEHPFLTGKSAMRLDNLSITAPDGKRISAINIARLRRRSVFDLHLYQAGTYRISVTANELMATWNNENGQAGRVRGATDLVLRSVPRNGKSIAITQHIFRYETFAIVSKPSNVNAVGVGLELRFRKGDASMLRARQGATQLILLLDGNPAAHIRGVLARGRTTARSHAEETEFITDAAGAFTIKFPEVGFYMLHATAVDEKTTAPQATKRSLTYTATLEVLPDS